MTMIVTMTTMTLLIRWIDLHSIAALPSNNEHFRLGHHTSVSVRSGEQGGGPDRWIREWSSFTQLTQMQVKSTNWHLVKVWVLSKICPKDSFSHPYHLYNKSASTPVRRAMVVTEDVKQTATVNIAMVANLGRNRTVCGSARLWVRLVSICSPSPWQDDAGAGKFQMGHRLLWSQESIVKIQVYKSI